MNTAIALRIAMAKDLPDELQEIIWKSYYKDTVLPWLMLKVEMKQLNNAYEKRFDRYRDYVIKQVNKLCAFYLENQLLFNMNMDFAEDRLLDDVFFEDGRHLFDMYLIIKENITHPYLLHLNLIDMVDTVRSHGRKKIDACILCDMFLKRLIVMISPSIIPYY